MTTIRELFSPTPPHVAQIGIAYLLVTSKAWICRIGDKQWDGPASGFDHARKLAVQCLAEQIRPITGQLIKLKKAGDL